MIIKNPETGRRFFHPDTRNKMAFTSGGYKLFGDSVNYEYENTGNGIIAKKTNNIEFDFSEYYNTARLIKAIEIDENDHFIVYNEENVQIPMSFRLLTVSFNKDKVLYNESFLTRENYKISSICSGEIGYWADAVQKNSSVTIDNNKSYQILNEFAERYANLHMRDIMSVCLDNTKCDDLFTTASLWFHIGNIYTHLNYYENSDYYKILTDNGFAKFELLNNDSLDGWNEKKYVKKLKKIYEALKGKTYEDMEKYKVELLVKYHYSLYNVFTLLFIDNFNNEEFNLFKIISDGEFNDEDIKRYNLFQKYINPDKSLTRLEVLKKIDDLRTSKECIPSHNKLHVVALVQCFKEIKNLSNEEVLINIIKKSKNYDDITNAVENLKQKCEEERKKKIEKLRKDIIYSNMDENSYKSDCTMSVTESVDNEHYYFYKVIALNDENHIVLNNIINYMEDFDKDDLFFYVYNKSKKPLAVLVINAKRKTVLPFPCNITQRNVVDIPNITKIGERYTAKFHNIFLNRELN